MRYVTNAVYDRAEKESFKVKPPNSAMTMVNSAATTLTGLAATTGEGFNPRDSSMYTSSDGFYHSPSPMRARSPESQRLDSSGTRNTRSGGGFETRLRERPGTSHGTATVDVHTDNVYTLAGIIPPPSPKFKPVPRVRGSAGSMRHGSAGSRHGLPSREVSLGREVTPRERRVMQVPTSPLSPSSPYNSGPNPWESPDMNYQWR